MQYICMPIVIGIIAIVLAAHSLKLKEAQRPSLLEVSVDVELSLIPLGHNQARHHSF